MNDHSLLFKQMSESLTKMAQETEKYSLVFKREDFFTFSNADKRNKLYKEEYVKLTRKINELYAPFEQCAVKLSSLLLESDREADEARFNRLSSVFTKCLALEKELFIFTSKTEQALATSAASVSALSEYSSRFLLLLKTFCDFLTQV